MKFRAVAFAALMMGTAAHADDSTTAPAPTQHPAAGAPLEADLQLGTFIGGRLKGSVYKGDSFTMDLEGLYGNDFLVWEPLTDSSSTVWGGGVRFNHYLSDNARSSWQLSPGVDFYDDNSKDAVFLAPSIDLSWVHEFSPQFGFVVGFQGGVQVGLSGHSSAGDSYAGRSIADIGTYLGLRF